VTAQVQREVAAPGADVQKEVKEPGAAKAEHGLSQAAVPLLNKLGWLSITNSMVVSWTVAVALIVFAQAATRKMQRVPAGAQNFWEWMVESLHKFLADWTVAPIVEISSGRPFNILTNQDTNNDQSNQTDRPNVAADGTLVLPAPFNSGSLGRNTGVTHSYSSLDMRLMRTVRIGERVRLNLIAEGFNLFNRFNEAAVSGFFEDVNSFKERAGSGAYYSRPTAAFDARQFQFGAKLSF
jgi:hypothetical protein